MRIWTTLAVLGAIVGGIAATSLSANAWSNCTTTCSGYGNYRTCNTTCY